MPSTVDSRKCKLSMATCFPGHFTVDRPLPERCSAEGVLACPIKAEEHTLVTDLSIDINEHMSDHNSCFPVYQLAHSPSYKSSRLPLRR